MHVASPRSVLRIHLFRPLVALCDHDDHAVQKLAVDNLLDLALANDTNRGAIRESGGLRTLVRLVQDENNTSSLREAAALALWGLARNTQNESEITAAGGVVALVQLAGSAAAGDAAREAAARALQCLATDTPNEDSICRAGGATILLNIVGNETLASDLRETGAKTLRNLATNPRIRAAIEADGGLGKLRALATDLSVSTGAREAAKAALRNFGDRSMDAEFNELQVGVGSSMTMPQNWDPQIVFTQRYMCEAELVPEQLALQRILYVPHPTVGVQVQLIIAPEHPCHGHRGLFAATPLPKGVAVLRYLGVVKQRVPGDTENNYLFAIRGCEIDVDAQQCGNESRYLNDFRGIGQRNVQFAERRGGTGEWEVWVETLRSISVGEELLVDYGSHFDMQSACSSQSDAGTDSDSDNGDQRSRSAGVSTQPSEPE